jgi:putative DNA primase/helicase
MGADHIGIALKGRHNGNGWLVRCPCPNHGKGRGDRSPSLSIADGDDGRLLATCFAGCEFLDILDALRRLGLVDEVPKSAGLALHRADYANRNAGGEISPSRVPIGNANHEPDAAALTIWRNGKPAAAGTTVAEYLERRGIPLTPPPSLRCGSVMHLSRYEMPTMVAAVQRPDGQVVAVQTTILTPKGAQAAVSVPKVTTGALGDGAVRFAAAAEVMGIAEGVETALSAQTMAEIPVWASLGCQRLHRVELPELVREVHIFGDNDAPGRTAAQRAAEVHMALGRHVVLRFPPDGLKDFNDLLNADADEYDAAQERGEVAKSTDTLRTGPVIPKQNNGKATVADIGLSRKDIHEARIIRDAEPIVGVAAA